MSKLCPSNHKDVWILAGGALLWCYRCGAVRPNHVYVQGLKVWQEPVGQTEANPALKDKCPADNWDNQ